MAANILSALEAAAARTDDPMNIAHPDIDFSDLGINGAGIVAPEDLEAEKLAEERSRRIIGLWDVFSLEDAYAERPPRKYILEGLLPCPSLSIVFGGPGSLKSMLLADMCMCVALGKNWLEPLPGDTKKGITLPTNAAPFLWIDFDNGKERSHERFEAVGKAHDIPASHSNARYVSMPRPWLDASKSDLIQQLAELIHHLGSKLVVIDNLGLITGDTEENSGEMAQVMGNLRWLCEETESAVIVVHHQRKGGGANDKGVRKGETLRGHSSIEAALDLALCIERKEGSDSVVVIPTKVRGYKEVDIFGARFTYEHKPGTKDLQAARFFAEQSISAEEASIIKISNTIKNALVAEGPLNSKDLVTAVRDTIAGEPGGKAPPINKVRGILKTLAEQGEVDESGSRQMRMYNAVRKHF